MKIDMEDLLTKDDVYKINLQLYLLNEILKALKQVLKEIKK